VRKASLIDSSRRIDLAAASGGRRCSSNSRATYAEGALRSGRFLMEKQNGLYDMQDVLGLK
jgi:hypothetical protein